MPYPQFLANWSKGGFYAVKVGRHGANQIYDTWEQTKAATHRYSGASMKKFATRAEAEIWLFGRSFKGVARGSGRDPHPKKNHVHADRPIHSLPAKPEPLTPSLQANLWYPSSSHTSSSHTSPSFGPFRFTWSRSPSPVKFESPQPPRDLDEYIPLPSSPISRACDESSLGKRSLPWDPQNESRDAQRRRIEVDSEPESEDDGPEEDKEEGPPLSEEQQGILAQALKGKSLFFTGSAGTGKSVLLRAIIKALRKQPGRAEHTVAVTAPTGIASVNVKGTTLHSFAGVGLAKEDVDKLVDKIVSSRRGTVAQRWRVTQTLVMDEISMVDGRFFDKLEAIARRVRNNPKPFGGMQLVICGDFFQLPPVPDITPKARANVTSTYAFEAKSWKKCVPLCYQLTQVFRQQDSRLVDMLNQMRVGIVDAATSAQFTRLARPLRYDDNIEPAQLFSLKRDVEAANNRRLQMLSDPTFTYHAVDKSATGGHGLPIHTPPETEKILERLVALKQVTLRIGAQVMLIQNLQQGHLVNGSLGRVVAFVRPKEAAMMQLDLARPETSNNVSDIPYTATKSPSCRANDKSLKGVAYECDCRREWCFAPSSDTDDPSEEEGDGDGPTHWPVVEFSCRNGERITLAMPPVKFDVVSVFGKEEAHRVQVPLILSWALSVHKSQGQTLERVKVDLSGVFENGQAYVALSRATSIQTLQVLNFDPALVRADSRVIEWTKTLRISKPSIPGDESDDFEEFVLGE